MKPRRPALVTAFALGLTLGLSMPSTAASPEDRRARSAQDARSDRGAALYDSGDFRGASDLFRELLETRPRSAALHYNLGNCLFRLGKTGEAIASYQRAFNILPRDPDIRFNLGFALEQAGEELVPPGIPPLVFRLFYLLSERELAALQWIACWLTLLLISLLLAQERMRQGPSAWCIAAAVLWTCAGGWWGLRLNMESGERGVIVTPSAEIRSGPGDNFKVSFTAPEGRRVEMISRTGEWLEIGVLKEGAKGWLPYDQVESYSR